MSAGLSLVSGRGLLVGWAVRETTTAAGARMAIRDGTAANGRMVVPLNMTADQSTRDFVPAPGFLFERGLFVDVTAGSVEGALFVILGELVESAVGPLPMHQYETGAYELGASLDG